MGKLGLLRLADAKEERPKEFLYNPVNVFRLINSLAHSPLFTLMRKNTATGSPPSCPPLL